MNIENLSPVQQMRAKKICQKIDEDIAMNPAHNPARLAKIYADGIFQSDPKLWVYLSEKYGFTEK